MRKYEKLKECIAAYGSAAVAFSSGVDSAFLLYAAKEALGDRVLAITAASAVFPQRERREAEEFCRTYEIPHRILVTDEMEVEGFAQNPPDRCYLCKKALFQKILDLSGQCGMDCVCEGSNLDDEGDYRPGLRAIAELGIKSPLRECGFTKQEIRELSERFGLPTWDKPSYACLASRFPYGEEITKERLAMVEKSEQALMELGFRQMRVRIHGNLARLELEEADLSRLTDPKLRAEIHDRLRSAGFAYVSVDLLGYRTGRLNEIL